MFTVARLLDSLAQLCGGGWSGEQLAAPRHFVQQASTLWTVLRAAFPSQENLDFSLKQRRSVRWADKRNPFRRTDKQPREGASTCPLQR